MLHRRCVGVSHTCARNIASNAKRRERSHRPKRNNGDTRTCCNPLASTRRERTTFDGEHGEEPGGRLLATFDSRFVNPTRPRVD